MSNEWADRLRVVLCGHGKEPFKLIRDSLPNVLEDEGFEVVWRRGYAIVPGDDVRSVIADEDIQKKSGAWLRQVDPDDLQDLVDTIDSESPHVRGYGVAVEDADYKHLLHEMEKYPLPDHWRFELALGPDVLADGSEWQEKPTKNRNAPFSYDPNNDYYTEPDRTGQ